MAVAYSQWVYRREASVADDECERLIEVAEPSWRVVYISPRRCLGALDLVRCGSGHRYDPMEQIGHDAAAGLPRALGLYADDSSQATLSRRRHSPRLRHRRSRPFNVRWPCRNLRAKNADLKSMINQPIVPNHVI